MIRWAVFVSGEGTNLQNFLDLEPQLSSQSLACVIADRACRAIERARAASKPVYVLDPKASDFVDQLLATLKKEKINRIFLLGYMRILPVEFLKRWEKPVVNLHPSLLPAHKGLHAIQKAYEAGDQEVGVSLHQVVEELDSGPLILQKSWKRSLNESFEELEAQFHEFERKIVKEYLFDLES